MQPCDAVETSYSDLRNCGSMSCQGIHVVRQTLAFYHFWRQSFVSQYQELSVVFPNDFTIQSNRSLFWVKLKELEMIVWAALFLALPLSALAQNHQLILVFGGVPRSRDVYLLSLNPKYEVPDCLLDLDQHPKEI